MFSVIRLLLGFVALGALVFYVFQGIPPQLQPSVAGELRETARFYGSGAHSWQNAVQIICLLMWLSGGLAHSVLLMVRRKPVRIFALIPLVSMVVFVILLPQSTLYVGAMPAVTDIESNHLPILMLGFTWSSVQVLDIVLPPWWKKKKTKHK